MKHHVARLALEVLFRRADSDSDAAPADGGEDAQPDECAASYDTKHWGLRIGAIFIILATSLIGTLAPILLRRSSYVPRAFFE